MDVGQGNGRVESVGSTVAWGQRHAKDEGRG